MSQNDGADHPESRSSSFPISSPSFWNEAAKVRTPPPPIKRERLVENDTPPGRELDELPAKRSRSDSSKTTLSYLPNRTAPMDIDDPHSYLANAEYAPNRFGDIGDYMRKKEIKVQTQNKDIALASAASGIPQIFAGISFYINGNTHPPMEDLRKMILQRGGETRPVLRSKGMVDYIIAPMLTQSKFKEFARYRVAMEGWITESCKEAKLLNWTRWKLQIVGGWEEGSKKGMEGFLKGQASQRKKPIKEEEEEEEGDSDIVLSAMSTAVVSSQAPPTLSASTQSLLVAPRHNPVRGSSATVLEVSGMELKPVKLEPTVLSPPSPPATPTKEPSNKQDTFVRPALAPIIPISPGVLREETPAKDRTPAKVHKPEGVWEYYYSKDSNQDAARLLKNQEWRLKNTAERGNEGGFIDGYYQNSR